jgi:plasmid stabilization system protein ParE
MRVRWTADAAEDLERISDYIAENRPDTARRIAMDIVRSADALDAFPNRRRQGRVEGTRELDWHRRWNPLTSSSPHRRGFQGRLTRRHPVILSSGTFIAASPPFRPSSPRTA